MPVAVFTVMGCPGIINPPLVGRKEQPMKKMYLKGVLRKWGNKRNKKPHRPSD